MPAAYAANDKRAELVRAASQLFHEQGFARTTIAEVAARAKVPLGNVYYYFETKEALGEAVIHAHVAALENGFETLRRDHATPRARLRRIVRAPLEGGALVLQFGCPYGSLCQELEKLGPKAPLARVAARILGVFVDGAESQFREHGFRAKEARALATDLVAAIQGTILVAHTFRSRDLLKTQLTRIERSLDDTLRRGVTS